MAQLKSLSTIRSEGYEREVHRQWELFVSGRPPESATVRNIVLGSWKRCLQAGFKPTQFTAATRVSEKDLLRLRETDLAYRYGVLILEDILAASSLPQGALSIVADRKLRVLHVAGDPQAVGRVTDCGIVPGALLDDTALGTNVACLTLESNAPAVLHRSEHLCAPLQVWQSSGFPIHCGANRQLMGVITFCSLGRYEWHAAFRYLQRAAKLMSLLINNHLEAERCMLLERHQEEELRYSSNAIVTLDSEGVLQAISPALSKLIPSATLQTYLGLPAAQAGFKLTLSSETSDELAYEITVGLHTGEYTKARLVPVNERGGSRRIGYVLSIPLFTRPRTGHPINQIKPARTEIVGRSPALLKALELARIAASHEDTVLLLGESGTGKEGVARLIHDYSSRREGPFVAVNCAASSDELISSELFGYAAGAFTGALREGKRGKIELANRGTLFLDEIGDMPVRMQQALLRVLEESEVLPLGSEHPRPIDVRIIAAANVPLAEKVRLGSFRLDLFHRLNVLAIPLPPLRERRDDIPLLIEHFFAVFGKRLTIDPQVMALLTSYSWPGNIRELRNLVLRWTRFVQRDFVSLDDIPAEMQAVENRVDLHLRTAEAEKQLIIEALANNAGNASKAATALGISRVTLYRKLRKLSLLS